MSKDYNPHAALIDHVKHALVDARYITGETPDEAKHRILKDLRSVRYIISCISNGRTDSALMLLNDWNQELTEKDVGFIGTGHIRQATDWYDRQMEKEKLAMHPTDINKPEREGDE